MCLVVVLFSFFAQVYPCTNLIVTKGASAEGYNTFTYAADSSLLYGELYFSPAADHGPNETREIIDWDSWRYLGTIPQAAHTYNVVGNLNENHVAIGESTWGGISVLQRQTGAILDYGSLIWIALERSTSARQAIEVIVNLSNQYGYYSSGESFTIADSDEIWVLDLIGKGNYAKGVVWVASRIPDGSISGHANQARTQTFDWHDPDNFLYAPDVMTFAQQIGRYPQDGKEEDFDFSAAYNPITFEGARMCDARVWSFFRRVLGAEKMDVFAEYVQGFDLTHGRLDLSYATNGTKISLAQLLDAMRDHYEGTVLEFNQDIGAGPYHLPYRWRPLTWSVDGKKYFHERSVGTQQTGWNFAAQLRGITDPRQQYKKHSLLWFGMDDCTTSVQIPLYPTITSVNPSLTYIQGVQDMSTFSFNSTFWVTDLLANFVYTDYQNIYPVVKTQIDAVHADFLKGVADADAAAAELAPFGEDTVNQYLTKLVNQWVDDTTARWLKVFTTLFPQYVDGVHKWPNPNDRNCNVEDIGYGDAWYARIVADTGDRYYNWGQNAHSHNATAADAKDDAAAAAAKAAAEQNERRKMDVLNRRAGRGDWSLQRKSG